MKFRPPALSTSTMPSTQSEVGYTRVSTAHACVTKYLHEYAVNPRPWLDWRVTRATRGTSGPRYKARRKDAKVFSDPRAFCGFPDPRAFRGSLIHEGLAAFYSGRDPEAALHALWVQAPSGLLGYADSLRRGALSALRTLVRADTIRIYGYTPDKTTIEQSLWSMDPVYDQRVDVVVTDPDDGVWVLDHKTSERAQTAAARACSGQYHGFAWLGRLNYGDRFRGVISHEIHLHKDGGVLGEKLLPLTGFEAAWPGFGAYVRQAYAKVDNALASSSPPRATRPEVCYSWNRPCAHYQHCFSAVRVVPKPA